MHMISKKDLSDAEMDTLTKSCSPTIVINANEEVQTHEEAIVYVKELDIFLTMKVLSFAMKTGIPTNGSMVNCESRNNHRYAVVVQDLATQWIQAYPCKTKTSQETQRSLQKCMTRYTQVDYIKILVTLVHRINKQKEYCLSLLLEL